MAGIDVSMWPAGIQEKLVAACDFVRRTGAAQVQIRYSDDEHPVVWLAVAVYPKGGEREGMRAEAAGGLSPLVALLRLCEQLCDGGRCAHCGRPTGFEPESIDAMPASQVVCWYQYDPEMKTFRRGCEGGV